MSISSFLSSKFINLIKGNYGLYNKEVFQVIKKNSPMNILQPDELILKTITHLAVPKNKYIISEREDIEYDLLERIENNKEFYNSFWDNNLYITNYEDKGRIEFFTFIVNKLVTHLIQTSKLNIIDIGCGTGYYINLLKKRCDENHIDAIYYGTDYSEAAIKRLNSNINDINFQLADIQNLPFEEQSFDLVCCMEVLEHIQFVDNAIINLINICKKDGLILITVPNGDIDTYIGHTNFWSFDQFYNKLNKLAIEVIESGYMDYYLSTKNYFMYYICKKKCNE